MRTDEIRGALLRVPPGPARAALLPAIYAAHLAGQLTDEQAAELDGLARGKARPPAAMRPTPAPARALQLQAPRLPLPRAPQRRQEPEKRRRWAASGYLPPKIAQGLTLGEQAVLAVVGSWCGLHGALAWSHARLAAVAGVSVTTVRNALRQARRLGLISCEERRESPYRHRPNVVRVICRSWTAWLAFRSRKGVKSQSPDNTVLENQGFSRGGVASSAAPGLDSHALRDRRKCQSRNQAGKTRSV